MHASLLSVCLSVLLCPCIRDWTFAGFHKIRYRLCPRRLNFAKIDEWMSYLTHRISETVYISRINRQVEKNVGKLNRRKSCWLNGIFEKVGTWTARLTWSCKQMLYRVLYLLSHSDKIRCKTEHGSISIYCEFHENRVNKTIILHKAYTKFSPCFLHLYLDLAYIRYKLPEHRLMIT